jgi:hypothetical protein
LIDCRCSHNRRGGDDRRALLPRDFSGLKEIDRENAVPSSGSLIDLALAALLLLLGLSLFLYLSRAVLASP